MESLSYLGTVLYYYGVYQDQDIEGLKSFISHQAL